MNKIWWGIHHLTIEDLKNKELVEELIDLWTPQKIPPCKICGERLTPGDIGKGRAIYHCSPYEEVDGRLELKEGRFLCDGHGAESQFTQYKFGDSFAMDLLNITLELLGLRKDNTPCEKCHGAGKIKDPNDPRDSIEGDSRRRVIKCPDCENAVCKACGKTK